MLTRIELIKSVLVDRVKITHNISILIVGSLITFLAYGKDQVANIYIDRSNNPVQNISPYLFGINTLYWEQDDEQRNNPEFKKSLQQLHPKIMRYPGGEIGDNFNWKTNSLNNPDQFPYSKNINDPNTRMDFDEFIQWKNSIGAEAIIVVNLENGFIENDLNKAADLAADWVRYAKEKNYRIKYWEVGNESYLRNTRYALKAEEYAKAFNLFAQKMKAVDPNIRLGAVGPIKPNNHSEVECLTNDELSLLHNTLTNKKSLLLNKCDGASKKWWDTVLSISVSNIDFVSVHKYFLDKKSMNNDNINYQNDLYNLKSYLTENTNKNIEIALTEWSFPDEFDQFNAGDVQNKQVIYAEMFSGLLKSNIDIANYFMIVKRIDKLGRSLLNDNYQPNELFYIFKAYATLSGDLLLNSRSNIQGIHIVSTVDSHTGLISSFIINASASPQQISIDSHLKDLAVIFDSTKYPESKFEKIQLSSHQVVLPAKSLMVISSKD